MTKEDMKVACMSLMWGRGNLPTQDVPIWLAEVREAGYDGVSLFHRELLRFMKEADLRGLLKDRNLALVSVDYSIDRNFDGLRAVCELMQSLNVRHLVTIGGIATRDADPAEIAAVLNAIGETALVYDVHACYHNHTGHTGETLEETEQLLARTDRAKFFGFLDTGTQQRISLGIQSRSAPRFSWSEIGTESIFWSSRIGRRSMTFAPRSARGLCDYNAVFRILKDRSYSGWITVEQNGRMGDKKPLECAKASRDFIRKGLGV